MVVLYVEGIPSSASLVPVVARVSHVCQRFQAESKLQNKLYDLYLNIFIHMRYRH